MISNAVPLTVGIDLNCDCLAIKITYQFSLKNFDVP
jgi:hypothetical protein